MNKQEVIFATGNEHKLAEVASILAQDWMQIISLKDLDFQADIDETGSTLEENALIKARHIAKLYPVRPVFSEDTGLEVMALGGAPGVHTARYAGPERDPQANMEKLKSELRGLDRTARFRTVIAWISGKEERLFEGYVNGAIAEQQRGEGGFGYDAIFVPFGNSKTFGELPANYKNGISHRFRALMRMKKFLESQVT